MMSNEEMRELMAIDLAKLPPDGGKEFNRLIFSRSPYLLQHARNPVDWHQWGEEAFARAAAEDKPVFLSIGYATCHWCHAMAHESFEDPEVAAVLNRHFISIKVDREERPDIDDQYMSISQMLTGSGGWPLNMFLTPEKRAFFAITYVPKHPRLGMTGLIELLEKIAELWRRERPRLDEHCAAIVSGLRQLAEPTAGEPPGERQAVEAFRQLEALYDPEFGGFGTAPKFPMAHYLLFLCRNASRGGPEALGMVAHTLRQIRCGGIYDQLAFGFHRYSVDRQWLVPHFEKMLYDQALLALAYLEGYQASGEKLFLEVAQELFDFVGREMTSPEGGFFAGLDADTEGEEGRYYLWTLSEVTAVVGPEAAATVARLFGITPRGNFEGRNIFFMPLLPEELAAREGLIPEILKADLGRWRAELLAARERRPRPLRDEKVLTAWNGLMIAALARGYAVTGEEAYRLAAERAVAFVEGNLTSAGGRLLRSFHGGSATVPAFLEDYACLGWGLVELHQATLEPAHLERALHLGREMVRLFSAQDHGGFFAVGNDADELPVRSRSAYDGVIPSANGVAVMNLLRLGRITGDGELRARGEEVLAAFAGSAARQPLGYLQLLLAGDYREDAAGELVLSGAPADPEFRSMIRAFNKRLRPGTVVRWSGEAPHGRPIARLCLKGACRPPAVGLQALGELLDELEGK